MQLLLRPMILALATLVLVPTTALTQQRKLAAVIDIDRCQGIAALERGVTDARASSETLNCLCHDVPPGGENVTGHGFVRHIQLGNQIACIFTGHACEADGRNVVFARDVPKV
ncbi:MAG TPA: hypothetical protein PK264_18625, partial [Hyphomicrobiaceae bacterium]|nr:hypothetical protein [Hyphomicrobiaceae bacterium]